MNKDTEINKKIKKLKIALKYTMKKWNDEKKILKSRYFSNFEKSVDTLHVRNLTFTNNVIQKINSNLIEMDNLSSNKNNNGLIEDKFNTSFMMLQSICNVGNKYSADHYDYELMSLKTIHSKLDNIGKSNREDKNFMKKKEKILEEFDSVKVKITEGFDFSPVTDLIDKIGDGFKFVIDGIIKVAKFVGELLKDFVILMFTLLKMLWEFITKFIPWASKKLWSIWKHLEKYVPKIGVFTVISYFTVKEIFHNLVACYLIPTLIVLTGQESKLADFLDASSRPGSKDPEVQLKEFLYEGVCHPLMVNLTQGTCRNFVLFNFFYIFWFKPEYLVNAQNLFIDLLLWCLTGPLKGLFSWVLGVDKNDDLFSKFNTSDPQQYLNKVTRLFNIIVKDTIMVAARAIGLLVSVSLFYKFLYEPNLSSYVPTIREITLVPLVAFKDILRIIGIDKLLPPYVEA